MEILLKELIGPYLLLNYTIRQVLIFFKTEYGYRLDVSSEVLFKLNTKEIFFFRTKNGDLIFYDIDEDCIIDHVMLYDYTN